MGYPPTFIKKFLIPTGKKKNTIFFLISRNKDLFFKNKDLQLIRKPIGKTTTKSEMYIKE